MDTYNLINLVDREVKKPYRFYHNMDHIMEIISDVKKEYPKVFWTDYKGNVLDQDVKDLHDLGVLFAVFHDVIYEPWRTDNEEKSIEYMKENLIRNRENSKHFDDLEKLITYSKYTFNHYTEVPVKYWKYLKYDLKVFLGDEDIYNSEIKIFKEYQFVDFIEFKNGRIQVLEKFKEKLEGLKTNIDERIKFWKTFKPRIGIFAGSFSPFHSGHRNILEKAEKMFDKVIIAAGVNRDKTDKIASNIKAEIKESTVYRQVEVYDSLLTTYIDSKKYPTTLIRGLRNGNDLSYEQNLANVLRDVKGKPLDIVYLACDREFEYISSSAVRQLKNFGLEMYK